jgi:hypothetical protein
MFVICEIYDAVNKKTVCDWFGFSFDQNLGGNDATFINIFEKFCQLKSLNLDHGSCVVNVKLGQK